MRVLQIWILRLVIVSGFLLLLSLPFCLVGLVIKAAIESSWSIVSVASLLFLALMVALAHFFAPVFLRGHDSEL